jgi:anti-sigma regulatory factor (Ser/Thr protein kinase)
MKMPSTGFRERTKRSILCLDRFPEQELAFYAMMRSKSEVHMVCDLQEFLDLFQEPHFTHGLLDVRTLLESPTAFLAELHGFRHRKPLGLISDLELEHYITALRYWGILQTTIKSQNLSESDFLHFMITLENPRSGFGLISYLAATVELYNIKVANLDSKVKAVDRVINHFATCGFKVHELYDVRLILEEITNNALFHAFRNAAGEEKYTIQSMESLEPHEEIRIEFGSDRHRVGFAVSDNAGNLRIETILGKIERQLNQQGLFDSSGRGLYLAQQLASRLIFNIEQGSRTQVIAMFDNNRSGSKINPMMINYVGEDLFEQWGSDPELD